MGDKSMEEETAETKVVAGSMTTVAPEETTNVAKANVAEGASSSDEYAKTGDDQGDHGDHDHDDQDDHGDQDHDDHDDQDDHDDHDHDDHEKITMTMTMTATTTKLSLSQKSQLNTKVFRICWLLV